MTWLEAYHRFKHPVNKFAAKLIVLGKADAIDFHRIAGRMHGYPDCCIEHYIYLEQILQVPAAKYMYDVYHHRHDLPLVLCHDCYAVYQQYVGVETEKEFG
jgi:hypothetical protein